MPLTALHAILATMAVIDNQRNLRIISEMPSDEACAGPVIKEMFDGEKWIGYRCVGGKGTKIEYEIIESGQPEDEILEEQPLHWKQRKAAEKYKRDLELHQARMREQQKRDQEKRKLFQERQRNMMRQRAQIARNRQKQQMEQQKRQQQQIDMHLKQQQQGRTQK